MAMAGIKRVPRCKSQLPACYFEGFLEKRSFKDKLSRKLWTSLCGNTLFMFNNNKDADYVEKQDLSNFISISDDLSADRNLDSARLHLKLKDDDIYLTAPSLETRELWKGYILSVVQLTLPTNLNLLPGQIHILREVVQKETQRLRELAERPQPPPPPTKIVPTFVPDHYMPILSEMPECYHMVSRTEAENLLEKNQEQGNLLLRPSRDNTSLAVTTRQELNGRSIFKHYRVTRCPDGGFDIAVDSPIRCNTLHDVITCLVAKTGGVLKPLLVEQMYERNITFVKNSKENGERTVQSGTSPPKVPPKPVSNQKSPVENDEGIYLNASDDEFGADEEPYLTPAPPPKPKGRTLIHHASMPDLQFSPGGALLPPVVQRVSSCVTPEMKPVITNRPPALLPLSNTDKLCHNLSQELRLKLNKKNPRQMV